MPREIAQSAAAIRDEADKMTRIIRQLLDFARTSTPRKQPVDLRSVVRQTIDMLGAIAEKQNVRLQFEPMRGDGGGRHRRRANPAGVDESDDERHPGHAAGRRKWSSASAAARCSHAGR